jgi:xanthine dehydrogenase YagS FAD-binding subunit
LREPGSEALAGGTDLLGELKNRIRSPERIVNIDTLGEWGKIDADRGNGLRIGAVVHLSEVKHHPSILEKFPILTQSVSLTATPQLRNMGTVGGNLCQHPRCWYYRSPLFPCWLKGGSKCFAVNGENRFHAILGRGMCQSVHPSDLAPALIALKACVKIAEARKEREIPLEELYTIPGQNHRQMTVLKPGELIREIQVSAPVKGSRGVYLKAMERKAWSFALVSLAAQLRLERDTIAEARLVLGGVAPIPWRAKEAEEVLRGQKISEELTSQAGEAAVAAARPLRDNGYKVQLVKGLFSKMLDAFL